MNDDRIRCVECSRAAPKAAHAEGWRAYIVSDPDSDDETDVTVVVFCRECGDREFGAVWHSDAA